VDASGSKLWSEARGEIVVVSRATFRELMSYFDRLRKIAAEAAEEGQGLLFNAVRDRVSGRSQALKSSLAQF
jgi:hypothetical protein